MTLTSRLLSCAHWDMESIKKDYSMGAMCNWPRDSAQYEGCCTHNSINEGGNCNSDLTPGKIEEQHEFSHKNMIRRKVATQKAKDLITREVARLRLRTTAALVRQRHPGRQRAAVRALYKKGGAIVKKAKTYWCDPCSQACVSALDLQDHNASRKHKLRK